MVSHKRTVCEKLFPKVSLRNSKIPQRILLKPRDVVCALFAGGGEKGSVTTTNTGQSFKKSAIRFDLLAMG